MRGSLVIPVELPLAELWARGEIGDAALVLGSPGFTPAEALLVSSLFGGVKETRQVVKQLRLLVVPQTKAVLLRTENYGILRWLDKACPTWAFAEADGMNRYTITGAGLVTLRSWLRGELRR